LWTLRFRRAYTTIVAVTVGLRELRENLKAFVDQAKAGEEVVITDRGKPVARILATDAQTMFERLVAEGCIRPALRPKTRLTDLKTRPQVRGGTVADILIKQRGG
jgi:prevent-host-death family protein